MDDVELRLRQEIRRLLEIYTLEDILTLNDMETEDVIVSLLASDPSFVLPDRRLLEFEMDE